MPHCPICAAAAPSCFEGTPYWMCSSCDCWFQSPLPRKAYEDVHASDGASQLVEPVMSDYDKKANRHLAEYLYGGWLGGQPAKTLDIGCAYPNLAHCLRDLGCDAFAMDIVGIVPERSRSFGLPILKADFERLSEGQIQEWTATQKFRLITLVHVFECFSDPLAALRTLRRLLTDDGSVFIRLPDHGVRGFERHLTPWHCALHPYFHAFGSLLELLVHGGDLFTVAHTFAIDGAGQRDLVLRPLTRKPVMCAGMIVKNEERDLPRCLRSIETIVDSVVVVDTGSSDATVQVAASTIAKPVYTQTFTGASRQDEGGNWKLWDFSRARNVFVDEIERRGADYLLWIDADDELLTPQNLRRAIYWSQFAVFGVQIESGGQRWIHHRLWKTDRKSVV